jgi:hypothetical protein
MNTPEASEIPRYVAIHERDIIKLNNKIEDLRSELDALGKAVADAFKQIAVDFQSTKPVSLTSQIDSRYSMPPMLNR